MLVNPMTKLPDYAAIMLRDLHLESMPDIYGVFFERAQECIGTDIQVMPKLESTSFPDNLLEVLEDGTATLPVAFQAMCLGLCSGKLSLAYSASRPILRKWEMHPKAEAIWELYLAAVPGESPLAEYVVMLVEAGVSWDDITDAAHGDIHQMNAICDAVGCHPDDIMGGVFPMEPEFENLESLGCEHEHEHEQIDLLSALEERLTAAESLAEQVAANDAAIKALRQQMNSKN